MILNQLISRGLVLALPFLLGACALTEEKLQAVRLHASESVSVSSNHPGLGILVVPGQDGKMALAECVEFALEKNFSIRMAAAREKSAAAGVKQAEGQFDPVLGAEVVNSRDAALGWGGPTVSGGLSKKFVTGTEVSAEVGDVYYRTGDFRNDYLGAKSASDFTISVRQPLLRGGWGVAGSGIKLAELLKEAATAEKTAEVLEMLRSSESAYWAAAVATDLAQRQRGSLERATKLYADAKARLEAGEASQLDMLEADVALAGAQERVVAADRAVADRLDDLWFVLGVPVDQRKASVTFKDSSQQALTTTRPDPVVSTQRALGQSPAAVLLVNEVQRREVELSRARNGLLPQVNLELNADHVRGSGSSSSAASGTQSASGFAGVALLRVSMPLTFRMERAELARAKAELERSQASRDQAELRLRQRISELCRAIIFGRESLRVAQTTQQAHEKKFAEQVLRHAEGIVSTHDLRLAQEELDAAEGRELQARLQLLVNQAALGQMDGSLAGAHGIVL